MININFVPDDYIKNNESRRTNLIYIILFVLMMVVLSGTFFSIKIRQKSLDNREKLIDFELNRRKEETQKVELLQNKRNKMWSTALTTVELVDPISKSLLLATLTNNLPNGVSLLRLNLIQKQAQAGLSSVSSAANKYQNLKEDKTKQTAYKQSVEQSLITHIDIEGIAPSDIEVAEYIEKLTNSVLFRNVALIESKEFEVKSSESQSSKKIRCFRLTAMLDRNVELTNDDVKKSLSIGGV